MSSAAEKIACDGPDCDSTGPVFMLDTLTEVVRLTTHSTAGDAAARKTLQRHFREFYHGLAGRVLIGDDDFQASWNQDARKVVPVFVATVPGFGPVGFELETDD